jgi:hypothetical protein
MTKIIALLLFTMAASTAACAEDYAPIKLEPGLWKAFTKSTHNGTPTGSAIQQTRCYSAAEFDDPINTFTRPNGDPKGCSRKHEVSGNTLVTTMSCNITLPDGKALSMETVGQVIFFDSKKFSISTLFTAAPLGGAKTVTTSESALEYVGPCTN